MYNISKTNFAFVNLHSLLKKFMSDVSSSDYHKHTYKPRQQLCYLVSQNKIHKIDWAIVYFNLNVTPNIRG